MDSNELLFSKKALWTLVWPLLVEQLLQITLGIADVFIVSYLGEAALSGVSLVDQINMLLFMLFGALGTGGAVICSQYVGRGDKKYADKSACQLIFTTTILALALLITGLVFYRQLLSLIFGAIEPDVKRNAEIYFIITLFALPFIALYSSASAIFRAQGNSKISMKIIFLVNAVNIAGNVLLIYVFKWGVAGVAVPTLLSRAVAAVVLMVLLLNNDSNDSKVAVSVRGISKEKLDIHLIWKILSVGIPNALENSAFQIGKILVLSLIATFGTSAIAANAAANSLAAFEVIPGSAIGLAMLTVTGQCMGSGRSDQAVYYTKKMMCMTYGFMWAINVPLVFLVPSIMGVFNMSPLAFRLGCWMTWIHGVCGILIWPLSFSLPNSLRAAGDNGFTMIVSVISMWTVRVGLSYVFKYTGIFGAVDYFGLDAEFCSVGVWIAMIIDWIVRSSFFVTRFHGGKWKTMKLI